MNQTLDKPRNMPANEDGEFELVLGNKGLLSAFFLVIILLGIFFTMGYLIGRNSGPGDLASRHTPQFDPATAPNPATKPQSAPAVETPSKPVETPAVTTASEPKRTTPIPEPTKPVAKPLEVSSVTNPPASARNTAPVRGSSLIGEPQVGQTYVQAVAVIGKPEAEVLAEVLSKKGFHTLVASGPNDKTYRVLVGPAKDPADIGKLKGDLEQLGFKGAFPKKY